MRIGLISDTHDLLRPEALAALAGCAAIVHAGDLCNPAVLERLRRVAPVHAVRGNNDRGAWARDLPERLTLSFEECVVHVVHDLARLDVDPRSAGVDVVVSGHSHRPRLEERDGAVFVNPGSAGPRRFRLPVALALLVVPTASAVGPGNSNVPRSGAGGAGAPAPLELGRAQGSAHLVRLGGVDPAPGRSRPGTGRSGRLPWMASLSLPG